jgi:5-methylcytosine-specific restriction endonuclease McrA
MFRRDSSASQRSGSTAILKSMTIWREGQPVKERGKYQPSQRRDFGTVIAAFWARAKAGAPRLALLIEVSEVEVWSRGTYRNRRRTHGGTLRCDVSGQCWACRKRKAAHRHHIIQLQHGGPNKRRNLVGLCIWCHVEVHPWMPVKVEEPTDDFRWLPKD